MTNNSSNQERLALTLLVGQTLFFGAAQSAMAVAAYTLFIDTFGAQILPYGYLTTALSISLAFYGLTWLQRKMTITKVLTTVMCSLAAIMILLWFLLQNWTIPWIAFALLPVTTFVFQWGFILPGLQVGRIFNVRQVKRLYPLVNAGLTIGFVLGGITAPILVAQTGLLASVLAEVAVLVVVTLVLVLLTTTIFKDSFAQPRQGGQPRSTKSLGQLLKQRYIRLILAIQILTTVVWHIVEFMYLVQTELRYPVVEDLAAFIGTFAAARSAAAVLIMLFVAGRLVDRYGLKLGLLSGPLGVGVGVLAVIATGLLLGIESTPLFWLIILTFGLHMVLEEGFTIPAQKTSYQLLPKDDRLATETMVEGIGMALAVGLSGLILLAFNALPNLTVLHAAWLAFAITMIWIGVAVYLTRDYARLLVDKLSRRVLDESSLTLSNGFDQTLIGNFLHSGDLAKVRLAINVLENRDVPNLHHHLLALVEDPKPEIRIEGLSRIEQHPDRDVLPQINRRLAAETELAVKGVALRALGAVGKADSVDQLVGYLDAPWPEVQQGAMVGLLKHGGASGRAVATERLMQLAHDAKADKRIIAAQIIGDAESAEHYQPLQLLLRDSNMTTRRSALNAAGRVKHPALLPDIVSNMMEIGAYRSVATRSLRQYGITLLPIVKMALDQTAAMACAAQKLPRQNHNLQPSNVALSNGQTDEATYSVETSCQLVQICSQIKEQEVIALLKQYMDHPESSVQKQVLAALSACHYQAKGKDEGEKVEAVLNGLVKRALYALTAKEEIGASEGAALLHSALAQSAIDIRKQVFYLLSFIYDSRAMRRAEEQIVHGPAAIRAVATEMLDVTLTTPHKNMVWPLINDKINSFGQLEKLTQKFPVTRLSRQEWLTELIEYPQIVPCEWIQTCALFAIGSEQQTEQLPAVQSLLTAREPILRETAQWAEERLLKNSIHPTADGPTLKNSEMLDADSAVRLIRNRMYLTLEKVALLKAIDIFASTPDHILASVAAIVEQLDMDEGETFIQQGDIGDCMYLIIDGEVLVHQGDDKILTLGPGKSVGELAILDMAPRETSVTTTQPTQLFRIDKEAFDEVLAERPEIALSVIRALSQRVRMTTAARQNSENE